MLSDPQAYACGEISRCVRRRDAMTETIIIKPSVRKQFDSFMAHGRVLFFSAPCGFGKTVLADALLRGQKVLRLNAGAPAFLRVRITFCGCTRARKNWHLYTSKRFLPFADICAVFGIVSAELEEIHIALRHIRFDCFRIACAELPVALQKRLQFGYRYSSLLISAPLCLADLTYALIWLPL